MSRVSLVPRDTQVCQVQKAMQALLGYPGCLVQWAHKEPRVCQGPTVSQAPEDPQEFLGSEVPLAPLACQEPLVRRVSQEHLDCRAQQALPRKA